ncbi:MAG: TonB family protein [Saprospiraceae bacterium]|jgi:TonB family protein
MFDKLKIWLRGDSNWKAEQELDRLGKNDAFLGDAMDGYRTMPESDHTKAVETLKARLAKRTKKKQGFIYWRSIAAAAAMVGVIGLFFWTQRDFGKSEVLVDASTVEKKEDRSATIIRTETKDLKPKNTVAMDVEEIAATASAAEKPEAPDNPLAFNESQKKQAKPKVDPSNIEAGFMEEENEEIYADEVTVPNIEEVEPVFEDMEIAQEEITEMANMASMPARELEKTDQSGSITIVEAPQNWVVVDKEPARKDESLINAKKEQVTSISGNSRIQANKLDRIENEFRLNGTVTENATGESMIGASILLKGTAEGTITNVDGNFALQSNQALPWKIVVSYTGYADQELVVNSMEDPLIITLNNNNLALSEIVVSGRGEKRQKRSMDDSIQNPEPQSSFRKLERYIKKNLKYPEIARQNGVAGAVIVRFFINADGKPEQLSVLGSLGSGCDEEAMRLMEEGPKWTPVNTWATYSVKFKL